MLDEINALRDANDLPPVEMAAVERADRYATGSVDWVSKFAVRCAELVLGLERY